MARRLAIIGLGHSGEAASIFCLIVKEVRRTSSLPIGRIVEINAESRAKLAEEGMLNRIDHNSRMPSPHHEVARRRTPNPMKRFHSSVKISRFGVLIRISSARVDRVDEVGTIEFRVRPAPLLQSSRDQGCALITLKCILRGSMSNDRRSLLYRPMRNLARAIGLPERTHAQA